MNGSRIALFGGSFDPPHVGHLLAAAYVQAVAEVDAVWLLPAARHPFGKSLTPFEQRVKLCTALAGELRGVEVSRIEAEPDLDGRTIHTVERLQSRHPDHRFSLIVGADIIDESHRWFEIERLATLVRFLVLGRGGHQPVRPQNGPLAGATFLWDVVMPEVSSTEVRRRLTAGEPVDQLVPAAVLREIKAQGMYR